MEQEKSNRLLAQGMRIRIARRSKGMTQTDLAIKCGYKDCTSIYKIEKGLQGLPLSRLDALCNALEVSRDYILSSEDTTTVYEDLDGYLALLKMAADDLAEAVYGLAESIAEALEKIKNTPR